jgi:hypothetical protein
VKWNYGESDKTSKPSKPRKNTYGLIVAVKMAKKITTLNYRLIMLFISGNGNGEKRDNNAGSAKKGVIGSTASTTMIPKDEVLTSSLGCLFRPEFRQFRGIPSHSAHPWLEPQFPRNSIIFRSHPCWNLCSGSNAMHFRNSARLM